MYNYPMIWKALRSFTRKTKVGNFFARAALLVENASREFPGIDDFEITGELGLVRSLSASWGEHACLLDVGANRGEWTAMALTFMEGSSEIRAFEPDSRLIGPLSSRFAGKRVFVVNFGLAASAGVISFFPQPLGLDAGNSFNPRGAHPSASQEMAVVSSGDIYLDEEDISSVQLLKIDTEGFEMQVLLGFQESLRKGLIEVIQFEYNFAAAREKLTLEHFLEFLAPFGYQVGRLSYSGIDFEYKIQWNNYDSAPNFVAVRSDLLAAINPRFI